MNTQKLNFHLEVFEGPLDLLLTLITKQKINIYDIPIARILDQYLDAMEQMQEKNAEIESSFIVMACELLYIKSKMLLPKDEKEEDPRTELVTALLEYSRVKYAAAFLEDRMASFLFRFSPKAQPYRVVRETQDADANELYEAIKSLRIAVREEREKKKKEDVTGIFSARVVSVEEKIIFLLRRLVKAVEYGNAVSLRALLADSPNRSDTVATFLATLALSSGGRIRFSHTGDDTVLSLVQK